MEGDRLAKTNGVNIVSLIIFLPPALNNLVALTIARRTLMLIYLYAEM